VLGLLDGLGAEGVPAQWVMICMSFHLKKLYKAWAAGRLVLAGRPGSGPLSHRTQPHSAPRRSALSRPVSPLWAQSFETES
jgi:hypothetical protein